MSAEPVVSVVVPVSRGDLRATQVAEGIAPALLRAGYSCEFLFVLDGPVGSIEHQLRSLQCGCPVQVVQLQGGGLGESIALSAGVAKARGRYIVNAPPYLQIEPEDVVKVVIALDAGADCVATWRSTRVDPWLNQLQSSIFNAVLRMVMGIPFHDLNSSTRGFQRRVLEEVAVYGELYRFIPVLARQQGFRVEEVKVRHREEMGRRGFYGVGVYLRRLLDILAITFLTRFTQRPLRFFGYVGFIAIVLGLLMVAQPLYAKIFGEGSLQDRPLFVMGAILGTFGVQLIGFGLIGEIIIFTQAPNLRDYKVEEPQPPEPGPGTGGAAPLPPGAPPPGGASPVMPPAAAPAPARASDEPLPLRVRELLPGEDAQWDAFVRSHPQGTFFHLSGWARVVQEVFRHESHPLVVERGRDWRGILPLAWVQSPFVGRNLVSIPYAVYGGVLALEDAAQEQLLARASDIGRELGCGYVELRHLEARPGQRVESRLYVTFRKELEGDAESILLAIPKKARAEVRRARDRHGITMRTDCDLDEFYQLFEENKRRLGSPALPRRWFAALLEEFGPDVVMHRAVDPQGRTLAAVMSFRFGTTLMAYYSGSRSGVNETGVNDFIYCSIMQWAAANGFRRFDFGRSRAESGPARFKHNMGFEAERLHYEYLLLRSGEHLPQFHPSNPKLELPRRIWSKLPHAITAPLGGRLSRYLP